MHPLSNLAYASRIASRIAYHHCIILFERCTWLIVFRLLVCLVWVEPGDEFANEEPVEFAFEDPVNSDNFAGKMIIPSKSLLSLLCQIARSFAMPMLRCLPFAFKPPYLPCQTSNPPYPSKPLIGYVPLCSAPLIALLVAGEVWRPFLVGTFIYLLGYHYIAMLS